MISVLILTRNEALELPGALASVSWSDDIHVLDSHSTDETVAIARAAGAHIAYRAFDNWSAHQNWAVKNIPFRHPWVFNLDADERVTPQLAEAMQAAAADPGAHVAFRIQRRDFFHGTWLRHVQTAPVYMRLFRPGKIRFERLVNPKPFPDGPVGQVAGFLDHYPFSKGIVAWIDRHNRYATFEAQQILLNRRDRKPFSWRAALTEPDFDRRHAQRKELFYRLPARHILKFLILYIGKFGFLDGAAGFDYCVLTCFYEYLIMLKTRELERESEPPAPTSSPNPAPRDTIAQA